MSKRRTRPAGTKNRPRKGGAASHPEPFVAKTLDGSEMTDARQAANPDERQVESGDVTPDVLQHAEGRNEPPLAHAEGPTVVSHNITGASPGSNGFPGADRSTSVEDDKYAQVPRSVTAIPQKQLSDATHRVYTAILGWAWNGGSCWASAAEIGKAAGGKDERSVRRALVKLKKIGLIAIEDDPSKPTHRRIIPLAIAQSTRTEVSAPPDRSVRGKKTGTSGRPGQKCPPTPATSGRPPRTEVYPKERMEEKQEETTTTDNPESSSSCSPVGFSEGERGEAEGMIREAFDGDAAVNSYRKDFPGGVKPEWVAEAIRVSQAHFTPKGYGFFRGTLRNIVQQGGPIGKAKRKPPSETRETPIPPPLERTPEEEELRRKRIEEAERSEKQRMEEWARTQAEEQAKNEQRARADKDLLMQHGWKIPDSPFKVAREVARLRRELGSKAACVATA